MAALLSLPSDCLHLIALRAQLLVPLLPSHFAVGHSFALKFDRNCIRIVKFDRKMFEIASK